jgi:hypothetical protein
MELCSSTGVAWNEQGRKEMLKADNTTYCREIEDLFQEVLLK